MQEIKRITNPTEQLLDTTLRMNGKTELRAFGKRTDNEWFRHKADLLSRAKEWEGEGVTIAMTQSLPWQFKKHGWEPQGSLTENKVERYNRLLFDFDRVKPNKRNATESELTESLKARDIFVAAMMGFGWPEPSIATSGNGGHALWFCMAQNTVQFRRLLSDLYKGLSDNFSTPDTKLDTTTCNASRVCRLYGLVNRKYPHSDRYPQRMAQVTSYSEALLEETEIRAAHKLYAPKPVPKAKFKPSPARSIGRGDWRTLDIVSWFQAKGLYIRPLSGGKHAVLCPWERLGEHDKSCDTDTVIWEMGDRGLPTFNCSHDTCSGRGSIIHLDSLLGDVHQFCKKPQGVSHGA